MYINIYIYTHIDTHILYVYIQHQCFTFLKMSSYTYLQYINLYFYILCICSFSFVA